MSAYGNHAYGVQAYGGVEIPNPIQIGVTEPAVTAQSTFASGSMIEFAAQSPAPLVGVTLSGLLYQPNGYAFGDNGFTGYGGEVVASFQFMADVSEALPTASGTLENPAMLVAAVAPLPIASMSILPGSVITVDAFSPLPASEAFLTFINDMSVTTTAPSPYAEMQLGKVVEVSFTTSLEPAPIVNVKLFSGHSVMFAAVEPKPLASASFKGFEVKAVEPKPVAAIDFNHGRLITGTAKEKKPVVAVSFMGDKAIHIAAVEKKPTVTALFNAGSLMTVGVTDLATSAKVRMVSGAIITGNVIDIKPVIQARIVQDGRLSIAATEPLPIVDITLNNTVVVDLATGEVSAWVLNTEVFAASEYTDWQFTHLAYVDGKAYGVKEDGLYLLAGETDNGVNIDSMFMSGESDNDEDRHKRVPLVHGDLDGDVAILVDVDNTEFAGEFNSRAKFGRGMRGNRLAFGVRSVDGSRFKVRSLEPVIEVLRKRVK